MFQMIHICLAATLLSELSIVSTQKFYFFNLQSSKNNPSLTETTKNIFHFSTHQPNIGKVNNKNEDYLLQPARWEISECSFKNLTKPE